MSYIAISCKQWTISNKSLLHFNWFTSREYPKTESSELLKWQAGYLYYHQLFPAMIRLPFKSLSAAQMSNFSNFLELGSSRSTKSEGRNRISEISPVKRPQINHAKILQLVPILHQKFTFCIPQQRRVVVPWVLFVSQFWHEIRVPHIEIVQFTHFQVNLPSTFRKYNIAEISYFKENHLYTCKTITMIGRSLTPRVRTIVPSLYRYSIT